MIDKKIFFVIVQRNFEFSRCDQKNAKIPAGANPAQTVAVIRANFTAITACQSADHNEYKQIYLRLAPYLEKQVRLQRVSEPLLDMHNNDSELVDET